MSQRARLVRRMSSSTPDPLGWSTWLWTPHVECASCMTSDMDMACMRTHRDGLVTKDELKQISAQVAEVGSGARGWALEHGLLWGSSGQDMRCPGLHAMEAAWPCAEGRHGAAYI